MPEQEKSAGVIIFRKEGKDIKYLLLFKRYKTEYWDLPKGNIEPGEEPLQTAEREAKEETGIIDLKFVPGFEEKLKWVYRLEGQLHFKTVVYYLAETVTKDVKISHEHFNFGWFTLSEAEKIIKHKDTKELLNKAQAFIEIKNKESLSRFM